MKRKHLKNEIQELTSRKKLADSNWKKILNALSKKEAIERSIIAYAMERCNMADYALLMKGYSI